MKHIKTYDEAINEGWIGKVWHTIFKDTYKVNYVAQLTDEKTGKEFSYDSYITVKAADADSAEEIFDKKWDQATKKMKDKPTVIVSSVKKTSKVARPDLKLPTHKKETKD
jgi:hypothetical protein